MHLASTNWGASFVALRTSNSGPNSILCSRVKCSSMDPDCSHPWIGSSPLWCNETALRLPPLYPTESPSIPVWDSTASGSPRQHLQGTVLQGYSARSRSAWHPFWRGRPMQVELEKTPLPIPGEPGSSSTYPEVPDQLRPCIQVWMPHPPGSNLPRKPYMYRYSWTNYSLVLDVSKQTCKDGTSKTLTSVHVAKYRPNEHAISKCSVRRLGRLFAVGMPQERRNSGLFKTGCHGIGHI